MIKSRNEKWDDRNKGIKNVHGYKSVRLRLAFNH